MPKYFILVPALMTFYSRSSDFETKFIPRKATKYYRSILNPSTMQILGLVFEFKLITSWHIARFMVRKDKDRYLQNKLRRMWQAGYLESFKMFTGSYAGIPVYYMLSREGLKILKYYSLNELTGYPKAEALFSEHSFRHEHQVVELASLEAMNKSKDFNVSFKGEASSLGQDYRDDKTIEAFTPDYTVYYTQGQKTQCIYTEFERTQKSKASMVRKLERYIYYLEYEHRKERIVRFIFQTPAMEKSFWLNLLAKRPDILERLRIMSTNLSLINQPKDFFKPIYRSRETFKVTRTDNKIQVEIMERMKLVEWV